MSGTSASIDVNDNTGAALVLCDTVGPFIRHVTYDHLGAPSAVADYTLNGTTPYVPVGAVTVCDTDAVTPADVAVSTGIRNITGTAGQDLKTAHPGLQSVTVAAITGGVNATLTEGAAVLVPAGVTLTWSVTDTDDSSLDAATFAGAAAGSNYLLAYTYKPTAAG